MFTSLGLLYHLGNDDGVTGSAPHDNLVEFSGSPGALSCLQKKRLQEKSALERVKQEAKDLPRTEQARLGSQLAEALARAAALEGRACNTQRRAKDTHARPERPLAEELARAVDAEGRTMNA